MCYNKTAKLNPTQGHIKMNEAELKQIVEDAVKSATQPLYEKIEQLSQQLEQILMTVSTSIE